MTEAARAHAALGMRNALVLPAWIVGFSFLGVGSLAREAGHPVGAALFATLLVWAAPAQLILYGSLARDGLNIAAAVAVALGNLIGNAVKYTAEGEVVVRLHPRSVEVVDSGPGLSPEDAARLFERGYRGTHAGHSQGGGIGLSIVRRLCDLYGWDVYVRPGTERGVVATLTFG